MYKFFLVIFALLPGISHAQTAKFNFGCSIPLFVKYNPILDEDPLQRMFGATGINALLKVNGQEENDMSFVMEAGFLDDVRPFRLDVNSKFTVNLYMVNINPTVSIPSRWQHIQYNLGFGTLIRLGQMVSTSISSDDPGGFYRHTNLDSVNNYLSANSKGILPYVTIGLSADMGKHFKLQFTIQPTFLNFYEPETAYTSFPAPHPAMVPPMPICLTNPFISG